MASRFWVGGTGTWDTTTTTHWSATSGGAGGATVPGTSDTVTFDANSNATSYTVTTSGSLASGTGLTAGGPTSGTLTLATASSRIEVGGNVVLTSGVSVTGSNGIGFTGSGTKTISMTSGVILSAIEVNGPTVQWQSNMTIGYGLKIDSGSFSTNGFTTTFDGSQGTMALEGNAFSFTNNVTFNMPSGVACQILSSVTVGGTMTFISSFAASISITAGLTLTAGTFVATGSSGKLLSFTSATAGTAWNLSVASGIVSCNFLSLKDSHAAGGASFYAGANSTNVSGNTGWIFSPAPWQVSVFDAVSIDDSFVALTYTQNIVVPGTVQGVRIINP